MRAPTADGELVAHRCTFARQLPPTGGSVVALTSDHTVDNLRYGAMKAALDRVVVIAAHKLGHRGLRAAVINPGRSIPAG